MGWWSCWPIVCIEDGEEAARYISGCGWPIIRCEEERPKSNSNPTITNMGWSLGPCDWRGTARRSLDWHSFKDVVCRVRQEASEWNRAQSNSYNLLWCCESPIFHPVSPSLSPQPERPLSELSPVSLEERLRLWTASRMECWNFRPVRRLSIGRFTDTDKQGWLTTRQICLDYRIFAYWTIYLSNMRLGSSLQFMSKCR